MSTGKIDEAPSRRQPGAAIGKMLARAHNDREARVLTDMIYQVDLTGTISEADAESLARAASERCFVENTIAKALPITTEFV